MATETPTRIVDRMGDRNWPSNKDLATFGPPFQNIASQELGLILERHNFHRHLSDSIPDRSGSAPPSMEGSFAAIGNLLTQQHDSTLVTSLSTLCDALENGMSEEQLRSHPSYFEYYCSNVNLNPRLPPPLISRENRRLVRHIGGLSKNRRLSSLDDGADELLHLSHGSLSTHEEETSEDRLLDQASENLIDDENAALPAHDISFTKSLHKSLVDLIQEDFPRTPSPVYNQSLLASRITTEQAIESDVHAIASSVSSISISKVSESSSCSSDVFLDQSNAVIDPVGLISASASLKNSPNTENSERTRSPQQEESRQKDACLEVFAAKTSSTRPDIPKLESRTKKSSNGESSRAKLDQQQSYGRNHPHINLSKQQGFPCQAQDIQSQVFSQGINHLEVALENHFSTAEVQPVFHSSSLTPPLYATAATYVAPGNPFYPNYHPSGLFSPQFNVGGYALASTLYPPFVAGYPSHGAVPLSFEPSGTNFNGRTAGVSIGEGIPPVSDLQHLSKLYAQPGFVYPPFVDPIHMQYTQRPIEDPYGGSVQHSPLASRGFSQAQINSFASQQDANPAAYLGDSKIQSPTNGNFSIPSLRKGVTGGNYGNTSNMSGIMQFPAPSLASPASPSSPVSGVNHLGRRTEMWFPPGLVRNAGLYSGWQGQRGSNNFDDPKRHSFLEELKSSSARKFELSDIAGRIVEFSVDQHGSRFIQQKLEHCSPEEKASVFKEVLPHASKLMTDVFGNYVIQKFFEHGTHEQRKELADRLVGQILPLSLQMYGCRVIQKALEVIELAQTVQLVRELDGHVMRCVRDQNGNHVIQKCIECVPSEEINFIISSFQGQVATLSTHPYGCRVIQRILEHCSDERQSQCIVDEILDSVIVLAQDQYGNYVIQHVLERGMPHERSQIISKLTGKFVQMSQHKYASNVVEKCLEHGDTIERELLIEEIMGQSEENDALLAMMKDQFANYVVQKIIEICNDEQREILLNHIKDHLQALKKYTYGKHIVARLEQLTESQVSAT